MTEFLVDLPGRLDVFLTAKGAAESRIKARDLIKNGHVLVGGRITRKPAHVLKDGEKVEVSPADEPATETRLKGVDLHLEVLYEDDACLVILKPAGIPVHPGVGIPRDAPTILHGLVHLFKERKIPFSSSTVLVHRLDKDTTGCLLVAKTPAAHKALQQQFADRTVTKTYLGIVAGVPERKDAVIDASIGRSSSDRTKMTVFGSARTREAKTTYRTVDASDKSAVLACDLHTGRTHQIRVHLSAIGHPLLGDASYTSSLSEDLSHEYDIKTICLHAWQLTFHSPATDKKVTVHSPAPKAFARAAKDLGLQMPKN